MEKKGIFELQREGEKEIPVIEKRIVGEMGNRKSLDDARPSRPAVQCEYQKMRHCSCPAELRINRAPRHC